MAARTTKKPAQAKKKPKAPAPRGELVVSHVLLATIHELGRVGYRALRIEDVATGARVHKTTIYRRFPTKVALVREAIQVAVDENMPLPDAGSFRRDLLAVAGYMVEFAVSATGQALVRMVMTESSEGDLRVIVDSLRDAKAEGLRRIFERAVARQELRPGVSGELLITTLIGSLHHSIFALGRVPSAADVEALVDLLLYGATTTLRGAE